MTKRLIWTEKQIRAATKIAKEQNVAIKLGYDGALYILPNYVDARSICDPSDPDDRGYF